MKAQKRSNHHQPSAESNGSDNQFSKHIWQILDPSDRELLAIAALIPPPVSLDTWTAASGCSSVQVLQFAEQLKALEVIEVFSPKGIGYYQFCDSHTASTIVETAGLKFIESLAQKMVDVFETVFVEDSQRWTAIAYLYQISRIQQPDLDTLIQAAEYCSHQNLIDEAAVYYQMIVDALFKSGIAENRALFIKAVIGLIQFKGEQLPLPEQEDVLSQAIKLAKETAEQDNLTTLLVMAGQVSFKQGKYDIAEQQLEEGWSRVKISESEELGKRVALATTEFLFFQGRLAEAIDRYEEVLGNLEELPTDGLTLKACALLGWAYGKCGQTIRGYGLISSVAEKAGELHLDNLVIYAKLMSILTLHDARRNAEAEKIIDELLEFPEVELGRYTLWPLYASKAFVYCGKGRYEEAFRMQKLAYRQAKESGFIHHRGPVNFEYIEKLEEEGYVHPEMNYDSEVNRVINWPDTYMQGVGYYYRAKRILKQGGSEVKAHQDLLRSMDCFDRSGAKLDQTFTQILLAQLLIKRHQISEARELLKDAWEVLKYTNELLFPEELKHYVTVDNGNEFLLTPLIEISNTIGTIRNRQKLLNQIISLTIRQTGAERGAFFVFNTNDQLEMIASRNLESETIRHHLFSSTLNMLSEVMKTGREVIITENDCPGRHLNPSGQSGWQLAYPIVLQNKVLGCFYLERKLSGYKVSEKTLSILKLIGTQVAVALDNVRAYEEIAELKERLEAETLFYRSEPSVMREVKDIVGDSPGIRKVISKIADVAPSDSSVLIIGETGVGKELVAKAVHQQSSRSTGPFIPVSVASLSEGLVTSELFGHEKGAFTNATKTHRGRFELADKGTLFLDEVNSLSPEVQAKLLRVLEERVFERVGGTRNITTDFRLIAATNQPLDQLVKSRQFRSDLFYRLNVYPIYIPPLRERKEDIPILVSHFVVQYNKKLNKTYHKTAKNSMLQLMAYDWPGNVRELKNMVERAVLTSKGNRLLFPDLISDGQQTSPDEEFLSWQEMESNYLKRVLEHCNGRVSGPKGAAKLLGLNPQTLYSKIKRLRIK